MQTFLPYPDFRRSAEVLDNRRLGKQRVEAMQILKALLDPSYGWQNHPAVAMWRGHEYSLAKYGLIVCQVWKEKGFKDTCQDKIHDLIEGLMSREDYYFTAIPPYWLGREDFHLSHQSNLLRKDFNYYSSYFVNVPVDLPYVWPRFDGASR